MSTEALAGYAKYDSYKESGVDWVGEVPKDWEVLKLKQIFYEKKHTKNMNLNCGSISFGKVIKKNDDSIPYSTKASYQEVLKGDFLINPLNLNYDLISLRIALSGIDVVVSAGYIVIKEKNLICKDYFKYLLHRYDVAYMKLLGSGVRQTISFSHIANSLLPIPSIKTQKDIAFFLDYETAKIDQAIELKQQQIEKLNEYKEIVVQNAVTKGLDLNIQMKDSGIDWIGEIPEHWDCSAIKRLLSIPITDGPHTTPEFYDEGVPFISAESIKNGVINFDKKRGYISILDYEKYSKKYQPKKNDIYMVKSGATTGRVAMVEVDKVFTIWSPLAVFRTKQDILLPKFLYLYLQSKSLQKGIELSWTFGTQQNIGMGVLGNLHCVVPSLEEQHKIISYLDSILSKVNATRDSYLEQIERLKEYKTILINQAVTGKIKVS